MIVAAEYENVIQSIVMLSVMSLIIRAALLLANQQWARGFHQLGSFIMLPVITFIITNVISGNIALSLGMVGALSIVRFRTPIRSPLELTILFALITMGISAQIDFAYSTILFIFIISFLLVFWVIQKLDISISKANFFSDRDIGSIDRFSVELSFNKRREEIEIKDNLASFHYNRDDNKWIYRLNFNDRKTLIDYNRKIISTDDGSLVHSTSSLD
jgi:hypothetical protein